MIFGCIFGLILMYKSKKLNVKLLSYLSLVIIFAGLIYLGNFLDFLTILLTGENLVYTYVSHAVLAQLWIAPGVLVSMYIGAEFLLPEKKKYIIWIFLVLGIAFELFIFLDPINSYEIIYPDSAGEDIVYDNLVFGSPAWILTFIFILSVLFFCGFGFLFKSIQSKGVLKKKFLFLSIAFLLYCIFGLLDTFVSPGIATIFVRIGLMSSCFFWYFGLREEPAETKEKRTKKEVKVKESLFRLYEKPAQITEEEVSISKERKICLVCKGKVGGIMFMCPKCGALYCLKCSEALSNLENLCWVCDETIDKTIPSKSCNKEEEDIFVEEGVPKKVGGEVKRRK